MKKIIIYTTDDKIISLHLVNDIISNPNYKNYRFDIFLTKPSFLRKIKILIVILLFGSIKDFLKRMKNKISISEIIKKNKQCKIVSEITEKYDYGLSVYCSSKIKVEDFKIYNFHLGSLQNQRGSFIFFYKFINDWKNVFLTFHEISDRFDVGEIINEREIKLNKNTTATDIFFIYLNNMDFLSKSIDKIEYGQRKNYKNFEKLNLVPNFIKLFKEIFQFFIQKKKR